MQSVVYFVLHVLVSLLSPLLGAECVVNIRDCGAVGDGKTPCTAPFQKVIEQCKTRGGGTVRLPAGTWLTGTVYLESNVTLVLEKDCTLLGSRKHEDYLQPRAAPGPGDKPSDFRYAASRSLNEKTTSRHHVAVPQSGIGREPLRGLLAGCAPGHDRYHADPQSATGASCRAAEIDVTCTTTEGGASWAVLPVGPV